MREHEAQAVLLVKAFEEADPDGLVLPLEERRRALDAAPDGPSTDPAARRARALLVILETRLPGTQALLRSTRLGAGLAPLVLLCAFVVGLLSNALGHHRRIDVWQWPFVALFAWNLLWYAIFLVGPLLHRGRPSDAGPGALSKGALAVASFAGRGARLAASLVDAALSRFTTRARKRDARTAAIAASATLHYADAWRRATGPLLAARTRLLLHAGSLALALGLVLGMYARGLTFRYEAQWESTVLDAPTLQRMVDALLGPAAAVLGHRVPDVVPYLSPSPAAPWLHLYAVATLLYVVLPRAAFFLRESARVARLCAAVPAALTPGYARRAGLASAGEGVRVHWSTYGYHPAARAIDAWVALLHDAYGTHAELERGPDAEYGDEGAATSGARGRCIVLASLAQTPESEVHGAYLAQSARAGDVLLVVDASPMVARGADAARLEERRRVWSRIGAEAGVRTAHVDLSAPIDDAAVEAVSGTAGAGSR